jgi:hypothetical protein
MKSDEFLDAPHEKNIIHKSRTFEAEFILTDSIRPTKALDPNNISLDSDYGYDSPGQPMPNK